jgi:pimeloyl-ACP methyl ester carboxylesterase
MISPTNSTHKVKNIVLVHGGFVDGSGWEAVYSSLKSKGYTVSIVQNPTISLADDVAVTKRAIAAQDGPVVLVGHSYGGVVITQAGTGPKVATLVYIAFAPDSGESVEALIKNPPLGAPAPPILPPQDGFLLLDRSKFAEGVCCRREARSGSVHGRFSGSLGSTGADRDSNGASMEVEAELVHGYHGRPHDTAECSTGHVEAGGLKGHRGQRESRSFCLSTGCSYITH